ncbi:MAG: glutamine ABC transporter substrate-binding protein GlnH, partial [Deltaproteobacteria bacterium]
MTKQNFFFSLFVFAILFTQTTELTAQSRKLIVGVKETAPFSFKNSKDQWAGISIELWQKIAKDLEMDFELKEMDLNSLLHGVENNSLNVAVAAISITSEREDYLDFSHPYYRTGLSIAIDYDKKSKFFSHI